MNVKVVLGREAGFFSDTLRIVQAVLIVSTMLSGRANLQIDSDNWLFRVKEGWADWFVSLPDEVTSDSQELNEPELAEKKLFTWGAYSEAAKFVYQLNPHLLGLTSAIQETFGLSNEPYVSLFIRRGDKLYEESVCIPTEVYCKKLLKSGIPFNTVYVQTDDIRTVGEVQKCLPDKKVISLCPPEKYGAYVYYYKPLEGSDCGIPANAEYFKGLLDKPVQTLVTDYDSEQMRGHVEEMLIGLELCKRSVVCCLDYQSNASRYLALTHPRGLEGILPVEGQEFQMDTLVQCPRYFPFWK